jgi:hypothetical protein
LKFIHSLLLCLLTTAALCGAQSASTPDTSATAPPSATGRDQAPDQPSGTPPPPSEPSAGQSAKPAAPNAGQAPGKEKDGQQPAKPAGASSSGTSNSGTSNDRLFFALPNFLTVQNSANIPPLTAAQKFKVVARGSFDPVQIVWYGALSGISQAEDSEPGFGQGAEGYGKRYGAYAADGTIENFFVGAIFPSLFREDPRYFQSGQGSFVHRAGYAVSRIFITRGDSGRQQFNISEVFGAAVASTISTYSYHPRADRTVANTASVWGSQVGYDTITLVVKEFWPDIRRKIKKQPH